jgi:hypothetical protein
MRLQPGKKLKQSLLTLAWLAVAVKLLTPIGFMPAPLSDGGLRFCPAGTVMGMLLPNRDPAGIEHHGPSGNGHDEHGGELAWDHCPYGALAKSTPASFALSVTIDAERPIPLPALAALSRSNSQARAFRARAPPAPFA